MVKALAVVFSGILFSLSCYLSQGFPLVFLPFMGGSDLAFVWAAPAGILMGVGCSLLGRAMKSEKTGSAGSRLPILLIGGFFVTIFMLVLEPAGTAQFYLMLFFLFPCAILVFGAMNGRLWAVATGALLQLLIGLGSSLDGQNIPGLLAYAMVYLAALELSWSSASLSAAQEREVAEAAGARGKRWVRTMTDRAAASFLVRLASCAAVASLAVASALAVFSNPGLFGPAYAGSFEAYTITALFLPGAAVLAVIALGLLVPPDFVARTKAFVGKARLASRTLAVHAKALQKEKELETF